jgi:hypothetical protein
MIVSMSRPPRIRRTAVAAAAVALIPIAAAAVLVSRSGGVGSPAANASTGNEARALLWHNLARCLRKHGHPDFRDPRIDSRGEPDFGAQGATVKRAVLTAGATCRAELAALSREGRDKAPTAAELRKMVLFSRCMRERGLSDWPDPRTDGTFPLNRRLLGLRGTRDRMRPCLPLMGARAKGIKVTPSVTATAGNAQ